MACNLRFPYPMSMHSGLIATLLMGSVTALAAQPPTMPAIVVGHYEQAPESPSAEAVRRGVELGMIEASRAGELLRREVRFVDERGGSPTSALEALRAKGAVAILAVLSDSATLPDVAGWAGRQRLPVILAASPAPAECSPFIFYIGTPRGSDARSMLAASRVSLSGDTSSLAGAGLSIQLWHSSLERFGAAQLSQRFRDRHGSGMTSESWAGWMAAKIVWESALRITSPDALTAQLVRGTFDGHKGEPLRFGRDHTLVQPLVILRRHSAGAEQVVAEVPYPESSTVAACRDDTP